MRQSARLSVIIPTHNRSAALLRLLRALERQTADASTFEVVVSVDGSRDGTADALRQCVFPFAVQVHEQPPRGPAAARNAGAAHASGDVLLFLDDDVEPSAGLIAAHLELHADRVNEIGIGRLPPAVPDDSMFSMMLRFWWETMQESARRAGHRYSFKDLLSGHFSIRRAAFAALGGFETSLTCHEDYELGYRALAAGMHFRLARGAAALHHDTSTVGKALQRKFDEGVADVALAQRHPALVNALPFSWSGPASRKKRLLRRLAWRQSPSVDTVVRAMPRLLPLFEALKLRFRWRALLEGLLDFWYWRGVASVLHRRSALDTLLATAPAPADAITIDLANGLDAAARELDVLRPAAVRFVWGDEIIATLPDYAGFERLRGEHLRPLLARWSPLQYLHAAASRGRMPAPLAAVTIERWKIAGSGGPAPLF